MGIVTLGFSRDDLEDGAGSDPDLTHDVPDGTSWTQQLRAKSTADEGTLTVSATLGSETKTADIEIETALTGVLMIIPAHFMVGGDLYVEATVTDSLGGELPRIPAGAVRLQFLQDNVVIGYADNLAGDDDVSLTVEIEDDVPVTVELVDIRDGGEEVLATQMVTKLVSDFDMLMEAIGERRRATNRSETDYPDGTAIATLASYAIDTLASYYIKNISMSNGSITKFNSGNTEIVSDPGAWQGTYEEWLRDCFEKVIVADSLSVSFDKNLCRFQGYVWDQRETEYYEVEEGGRTVTKCRWKYTEGHDKSKFLEELDDDYSTVATSGDEGYASTYLYWSTGEPGEMYSGTVSGWKILQTIECKCLYNYGKEFIRTARWLGHSESYQVFAKFGHQVPDTGSYYYVLTDQTAGVNEDWRFCPAQTLDSTMDNPTEWDDTTRGYKLYVNACILQFHFTYREDDNA